MLFTSAVDEHGVPDLRLSDPGKRDQCFHEKRCGICGVVMLDLMVFLGGPMAVQNRCFGDPPMHWPCAEYSIKVCPYLAHARDRHVPMGAEIDGGTVVNTPQGIETKGAYLALYSARSYIGCRGDAGGYVFYADLPVSIRWYEQATGERVKAQTTPRREAPPRELRIIPSWQRLKHYS